MEVAGDKVGKEVGSGIKKPKKRKVEDFFCQWMVQVVEASY